jgi:type I restriction enzyme R subunit
MPDQFGLKPEVVEAIRAVLAQFDCITEAILYGSRAKGTYQNGSDIDLTLKIQGEPPKSLLLDIHNGLDDLDLPYSFDLSFLTQISNESLLNHIDRVGVEFFKVK